MQPLAIVKDFDVLKDRRPGLLPRGVALPVHQLAFKRGPEALGQPPESKPRSVTIDPARVAEPKKML